MSTEDGELDVAEGRLYWRLDRPSEPSRGRPTLLFLHAAVTDHTLWDGQVSYFVARGWNCLRCDRLGFGRSHASEAFLRSQPRPAVDHIAHVRRLIEHVLPSAAAAAAVVVIGLSMGGNLAIDVACAHPVLPVRGLVVAAGGVPDAGEPNAPAEDALFERHEALLRAGDVEAAAATQVRIWGDGPLQPEGRLVGPVGDRMMIWNREIAARERAHTGGMALDMVLGRPQLEGIVVPTALAIGLYDETNTTTGMLEIGRKVPGAVIERFATAHMINLEDEMGFNAWLGSWLDRHFMTAAD